MGTIKKEKVIGLVVLICLPLLLVFLAPTYSKSDRLETACKEMGKVMETQKAVLVGKMCCTEYSCQEIKL